MHDSRNRRVTILAAAAFTFACEGVAEPEASMRVVVTPAQVSIHPSESVTFSAQLLDGDGDPVEGAIVWSISNPAIGAFTADGDHAHLAPSWFGGVTVEARSGSASGAAEVTIERYEVDIWGPATLDLGTTAEFMAFWDVTDPMVFSPATIATWSSSDTTVARIEQAANGRAVVRAVGPGVADIVATLAPDLSDRLAIAVPAAPPVPPDSSIIYFIREGPYPEVAIHAVRADATSMRTVRSFATTGSIDGLDVSGSLLAYSSRMDDPFSGNPTSIVVIDTTGAAVTTINARHWNFQPAIDPAAEHIAFTMRASQWATESFIGVRALSGSVIDSLAVGHSPAWSPDGQSIAFVHGDTILRIARTGGMPTVIARLAVEPADLDWSPDGSRLLFTGYAGSYEGDIYMIGADGTGLARLVGLSGNDGSPSWSPDGTRFAFSREYTIAIQALDATSHVELVRRAGEYVLDMYTAWGH